MTKIKNVFDEHINKEEIREMVLNDKKVFVFKPVYVMYLLLIGLLILPINNHKNKIYINTVNSLATQDIDVKIILRASYNSKYFHEHYPFLKELDKEYAWDLHYVYVKDNNNEYTQLHDTVFEFWKDDDQNDKRFEIRISSIKDPLRDTIIETSKNKTSNINGTSMKIYQYNELYFVSFKYNDQYYYVESHKLNMNEFIDVLTMLV